MKFGRFKRDEDEFVGVLSEDAVYPLRKLVGARYPIHDDLESFIALGPEAVRMAADSLLRKDMKAVSVPLDSLTVLAPMQPRKNIFCVGRNYIEHVKEGDRASGRNVGAPLRPIFFTKPRTTVIGPGDKILYHTCTQKLDYECEVAVVIGTRCTNVKAEDAVQYIFGYTIVNDVTARDLQDGHSQWFKGKSLDSFCPMGPFVATRDELGWPLNTALRLWVNGELRQSMSTRDMIFDVPKVIEELSSGLTLEPGDVIATGTGPGCGFGFDPPKFLSVGDEVKLQVDGIGTLTNTVAQG